MQSIMMESGLPQITSGFRPAAYATAVMRDPVPGNTYSESGAGKFASMFVAKNKVPGFDRYETAWK